MDFQAVMQALGQGGPVSLLVALLLLAMSVASWIVMGWKVWLLRGTSHSIARASAAFWQSPTWPDARNSLQTFDSGRWLLPLLNATLALPRPGSLAHAAHSANPAAQCTSRLRDALQGVLQRLQFGQVLLATVGSTAPFVGLLGTVWGIYHALLDLGRAGAPGAAQSLTLGQVSGPVGEALIMTAAGLAVAIPAVLAYNIFGRRIAAIESQLEGFAFDLRESLASLNFRESPSDQASAPMAPAQTSPALP